MKGDLLSFVTKRGSKSKAREMGHEKVSLPKVDGTSVMQITGSPFAKLSNNQWLFVFGHCKKQVLKARAKWKHMC